MDNNEKLNASYFNRFYLLNDDCHDNVTMISDQKMNCMHAHLRKSKLGKIIIRGNYLRFGICYNRFLIDCIAIDRAK
ncbi:hypothetical protein DERP_007624 [Dermatophagoides pteronyssinus]|uniref:Uncharacterized protein n=1 Tax=Dermatophagoides pteronyssinus TaxID=6956 RepID=A0ABQ8JKQ4_DERPT|nr:hypothetical protein DERP_007624 [Dermatophagoides pteronyssinus]